MAIVIVFWSILLAVLLAYCVVLRRELVALMRKKRQHYNDPILEIMRRYEVGELTQDEFKSHLLQEMERYRAQEKTRAS